MSHPLAPTLRASIVARCQQRGPEVNMFEQVSRGGGPCPVGSLSSEVPCLQVGGAGVGGWVRYCEVNITDNGHMGTPPDRLTDEQTRLKTLPSHNFVGER